MEKGRMIVGMALASSQFRAKIIKHFHFPANQSMILICLDSTDIATYWEVDNKRLIASKNAFSWIALDCPASNPTGWYNDIWRWSKFICASDDRIVLCTPVCATNNSRDLPRILKLRSTKWLHQHDLLGLKPNSWHTSEEWK